MKKGNFKWMKVFMLPLFLLLMVLLSCTTVLAEEDTECTVRFFNLKGTRMLAPEMTVEKGGSIILPDVKVKSKWTNFGWVTKKGDKTAELYKIGGKYKIDRDWDLYLVQYLTKRVRSVSFNNNNGTSSSTAYLSLNKQVVYNSVIELPKIPVVTGYINIGWTTTKGGSEPLYTPGQKVQVRNNVTFYAVRRNVGTYVISFYSSTGGTNKTYKNLKKIVQAGESVVLPDVPAKEGYVGSGWSTKKNSTVVEYKEGELYTGQENVSLYAVQKKAVTVTLCHSSGTLWKKYSVVQGGSFRLPGVANTKTATIMGWSRSARQQVNPQYQVGGVLSNLKSSVKLYLVAFKKSTEEDLRAVGTLDMTKYKKAIFVGDSRTAHMFETLNRQFSDSVLEGVRTVSLGGSGLSWLKEDGYRELMAAVGTGGTKKLPIAIVFNHGANDLGNISAYITYMKQLAEKLQPLNCKLFYMSINPLNNKMLMKYGFSSRPEQNVRSFNTQIKSGLCTKSVGFTYIDAYTYLMKNGYTTNHGYEGVDGPDDDGLHYSTKTYKRIYNFCIEEINKA